MKANKKGTGFPWLHSHGPIEGGAFPAVRPVVRRFPWLHSHGPIEGFASGIRHGQHIAHFRGYTATAPLKGRDRIRSDNRVPNFRGYTATAPLKRYSSWSSSSSLSISVATQPRPH